MIHSSLFFFAVSAEQTLDKLVDIVSLKYPAFLVLAFSGVLGFVLKDAIQFHRKNYDNKIEIEDKFDKTTFEKAVLPVLGQLNEEMQEGTLAAIQIDDVTLQGREEISRVIKEYEMEKHKNLSQIDISTLESSLVLTETVENMLSEKRSKYSFRNIYQRTRNTALVLAITLAVNLLLGIVLVILNDDAFSLLFWTRTVGILWIVMCIANLALGASYLTLRTQLDGFIHED